MASFTEVAVRRLAVSTRLPPSTARLAAVSAARQRNFTYTNYNTFVTSTPRSKTATEAAKDTLKTVDRVVSDKLVDGIDIGANVASKVKQAGEEIQNKAKGLSADDVKDEAEKFGQKVQEDSKEKLGKAKTKVDETKKKYGI